MKNWRLAFTIASGALCLAGCAGIGARTEFEERSLPLSITLTNEVGRIVSNGNGARRTFLTYDARGREYASQHILDGLSYVYLTTFGFPCASDACSGTSTAVNGPVVVTSQFPDNEKVTYTYDRGGSQQSISTTPTGGVPQIIVSQVLRNAHGQTTRIDYGDKTSSTWTYNDSSDLRLNQLETFLTATPTTIRQLYTYSYDNNDNVVAVNDYCDESVVASCSSSSQNTTYSSTYSYDSRNQLIKAIRGGNTYVYSYDSVGNLTFKDGVTQTYPTAGQPRPHAIKTAGAFTYTYDANGNLTTATGGASNPILSWNASNMPIKTVYGSTTTTKSFLGESLWKKVQGTTTTYYPPSMRIENSLDRKFFGSIAERDPTDTTGCSVNATKGCLKFYHGDNLKSSTLVTALDGSAVHRQSYKPYGEDIVASPPGPFTPKYQFNFKEKEADGSGFYDYGARMYNPATGRWLSPDTRLADGLNRYTYVRNNPIRLIDPTGHIAKVFDKEGVPDVLKALQRLAPGTTIDGQNVVHKPGKWQTVKNYFTGHAKGTSLVSQVVDSKNVAMIFIIAPDAKSIAKPAGGEFSKSWEADRKGEDVILEWNPNVRVQIPEKSGSGDNARITWGNHDAAIGLGHELIHSLHMMTEPTPERSTRIHLFFDGPTIHFEQLDASEFRTVGFDGFHSSTDITENDLRGELGMPARAAYCDQTSDWDRPSSQSRP